ncbi:MAG TPA: YcxB family protein [Pyrinomonadaceae bacterium]|nr:YcxB family protein [Pyrinomonadaceae bacterium]
MQQPIEIVYTTTRDEYIRALRRHFKTKIHPVRDVVFGFAAIGLGLFNFWVSESTWFGWIAVIAGVLLLLVVVYGLVILPSLFYNSQPLLKSQYHLTFSNDEMRFRAEGVDSMINWPFYRSWLRDDDFYILYYGKRDLSVIPRRAFRTAEDDDALFDLLRQKIGHPER